MTTIEYRPEHEKPRPRKGDRRFGPIKLTSGFNEVDKEAWEAVKDDSVVKALLECDAIKVGGKAPKEVAEAKPAATTKSRSTES